MDHEGRWTFAPAFDFTFSYGSGGEHNMTVIGDGRHLVGHCWKNWEQQLGSIIGEVNAAVKQWHDFASEAGVSLSSTNMIENTLKRIK